METHAPHRSVTTTRTGIDGFDDITGGGLPRGRTTLVLGGPGCGKTVFALQSLVHGAHRMKESGTFVAFEEDTGQIVANAATLGWALPALKKKHLHFFDVRLSPDVAKGGDFDLIGMLALLRVQAEAIHAKRIVFDGIDLLLGLLDDAVAERREIYRICDWLAQTGLTGIITQKASGTGVRWEWEQEERAGTKRIQVAADLKRLQLQLAQAEATARLKVIHTEMEARHAELAVLADATGSASILISADRAVLRKMRYTDDDTRSAARRAPPCRGTPRREKRAHLP